MARYIDAEKYPCKGCPIEYCYENCKKFYAWLEGCDYDVEAVVAELEKEMPIVKGERTEDIPLARFMWNQALAKAVSIVRGKE